MKDSYSITAESCKIEHEYENTDMIYWIKKACVEIGGDKTLNEAVEILKNRTRFAVQANSPYVNVTSLH